ncbi:MAG: nucleotidyltransferase family protein [Bacillota bacterium]|nr:nucleotidyltransferase family protein [Bacillota bacterium]
MTVAGIVAEYNPFHCGHEWHIKQTKKEADAIVCVMSGAFTQRGTPALIDKWARAKCAASCGANLVMELPYPFSSAPAEIFAYGAVDLLGKLGVVDILSFGSECGEIKPLKDTAKVLEKKGREISEDIKARAGEGKSYAAAVAEAVSEITDATVMESPNNLLGIKYIMAIDRLGLAIEPFTIKREGAGYNDQSLENNFVSAAALRNEISIGREDKINLFMPQKAAEILKEEKQLGKLYDFKLLDALFTGIIRREGKGIAKYAYIAEGLENRFALAAEKYSSIAEIIDYVKTKRYTHTRLSRIASAILVGMSKECLAENISGGAGYAKVLAADNKGLEILKKIKKNGIIPVISRGGDYVNLPPFAKAQFELEMRAQNIAALCCEKKDMRIAHRDLLQCPYIKEGKDD